MHTPLKWCIECGVHCAAIVSQAVTGNTPATCVPQEKGAGAPSGDNPLKPGETPKPKKRSFHTSGASWADDKRAADTDSPTGNAKGRT